MAFPGRRGRGRGGWGRGRGRGWGPRPWGPRRRPGLGLAIGALAVGAAVAAPPPRRRGPPRVIVANPNYPAARATPVAVKPVIVNILKKGFLEIEYHFIVRYYKRKHFVLRSDLKLEYYSYSSQSVSRKPDGVINLLHVKVLKKVDGAMFELEINNHTNAGAVDLGKLFTPETVTWRFKCDNDQERNQWFESIAALIGSQSQKPITYLERQSAPVSEQKEDFVAPSAPIEPSAPPEPAAAAQPGGAPVPYDDYNNGNMYGDGNMYADEGQVTNQ